MHSDRLRNGLSFAVICGFSLMLAATSKPGSSSPSPAPLPVPTQSPQTGLGTPPTNGVNGGPDINALSLSINCPKSGHPACRLLTDFLLATPYADAPVTGQNVVWYGETTGIGLAGNMKKEFFFVQVEGTPEGSNASPRSLIPSNPKETKEAGDIVYALRNGKPVPVNSASNYIKTAGGNMKRLKINNGSSEFVLESPRMTYFRRIGNRLLILEDQAAPLRHGSTGTFANAWIAETWMVR